MMGNDSSRLRIPLQIKDKDSSQIPAIGKYRFISFHLFSLLLVIFITIVSNLFVIRLCSELGWIAPIHGISIFTQMKCGNKT